MRKKLFRTSLVLSMAAMLAFAGCGEKNSNSNGKEKQPVGDVKDSGYVDYKYEKQPGTAQFDFAGNYASPELIMDGRGDEEQWKNANVLATLGHDNAVNVKAYRGDSALFFLFEVADDVLLTEGETNDDAVTRSDSIEFYLDTHADGGTKPQNDDYQINLGIHGKTRIMQGSGSGWGNWSGLIDYEVALNGTLNDSADTTDTGYSIEVMIPYSQINIEKDDMIAVSFGHVDKEGLGNQSGTDWAWYGWEFEGFFCEPQTPNNYILLDKDNNPAMREGMVVEEIPEGMAVTEEFGLKNANFADSVLTLTREDEGLKFSFVGTRRLSGHVELYLDTKECADHRDNDATCWRFDLKDDGTIGGTHFAGGELVTEGLTYTLDRNGDDGYEATLLIPYSYLDIAADEVFGISLGQWSTTANDWDGWGHQGMFVAPETPATYVRVSADCEFFRSDVNEAPAPSGTTEEFGLKNANFADSILTLTREKDGLNFNFVGTRRLSGHVELYLDTKECADHRDNDATCWRFDLKDDGTIGGTHFAGGELVTEGLTYTLGRNGDDGYEAILFIPYSYLDIAADEVFGISLGRWSTTANDWDGWGHKGMFVAPETPATYVRVSADCEFFRNNVNEAPVASDEAAANDEVDYTGYTEAAVFGGKADTFADSTLRLKRTEDGIIFDFTGTRRLSGHVELYLDTKECADHRDTDATCWRFDLADSGVIGGTHFAGGALVTEGLTYELVRNGDNGYRATLFVPYSYLDIVADEVFGISLGQWSTAAMDWDGWAFENQFVAPETPAAYIRIGADGKLYRASDNTAQ